MSNIQAHTSIVAENPVEQTLSEAPARSITRYALQSLTEMMRRRHAPACDETLLRLWVTEMLLDGKKESTVRRYLSKARAVYTLHDPESDAAFASVQTAFGPAECSVSAEAAENLKLTARVVARLERDSDSQDAAIFMYLLYNPTVTTDDAAGLTFGNAPDYCAQTTELVKRFDSSHGRKYVFALGQGKVRPGEISRRVACAIRQTAAAAGMRTSENFTRENITAIWIAAALQCGIEPAEIYGTVGSLPREYAALSIAGKSEPDSDRRKEIICRVAEAINSHAQRWFVMRLRKGVQLDDIRARIDARNPLTFYYPTRTEIRKEGHRRIVADVPYLPATVFFRTRRDRVRPLMAKIGELAWCFKSGSGTDSEYAAVPDRQMTAFQRYIGNFTPDIRLELVSGGQVLECGRRVRVTGGIMEGYEGTILDVEGQPGRRIFTLALTDAQQARWTAHVDDIYLTPLD